MKIYLETERMILREFEEDDVHNIFELDSDPLVMKYLPGDTPPKFEFIRDEIIPRFLAYKNHKSKLGYWVALRKEDDAFMGWFHFRPHRMAPEEIELGYRLKQAFWGKGYATEGSKALIEKGFTELNTPVVVAITDPENKASRRVMEKAGLEYEKNYPEPDGFVVAKYRLDRKKYFSVRKP